MFCTNCGTQYDEAQAACPMCGQANSKYQGFQQATGVQAPAQQAYPAATGQQAYAATAGQQFQQATGQAQYQQAPAQFQQPAAQPWQQATGQAQQPAAQPWQQATSQQPYQPVGGQQFQQGYQYAGGANPQYQNMGGWLLFFMVMTILGIVSSLVSVVQVNGEWSQYAPYASLAGLGGYNTFFAVWTFLIVVMVALQAVYVVLVFMRKDIFLKFYQIATIVNFVLYIVILVYGNSLPYGGDVVGGQVGTLIGGAIGTVIGLVLYTMYYCKSERVRTYMGSTSYIEKALFKIGA